MDYWSSSFNPPNYFTSARDSNRKTQKHRKVQKTQKTQRIRILDYWAYSIFSTSTRDKSFVIKYFSFSSLSNSPKNSINFLSSFVTICSQTLSSFSSVGLRPRIIVLFTYPLSFFHVHITVMAMSEHRIVNFRQPGKRTETLQ